MVYPRSSITLKYLLGYVAMRWEVASMFVTEIGVV